MPVERIFTRGEVPGEFLANAIVEIEQKGTVTAIVPMQDEILVVWQPKAKTKTEHRTA